MDPRSPFPGLASLAGATGGPSSARLDARRAVLQRIAPPWPAPPVVAALAPHLEPTDSTCRIAARRLRRPRRDAGPTGDTAATSVRERGPCSDRGNEWTTVRVPPRGLRPQADGVSGRRDVRLGRPVQQATLTPLVSWTWNFGGIGTSSQQNPNFTFVDNGTYTVTLTVTDDDGSIETAQQTVTVLNASPIILTVSDLDGYEGELLEFTATFHDPGVLDTHTGVIDWGDGTSGQAEVVATPGPTGNPDATFARERDTGERRACGRG